MKKFILTGVVFLAVLTAYSQERKPRTTEQKVEKRLEYLATELNLSPEQKAAMKPIMISKANAMEKEKEKIEAAKNNMKNIQKNADKEIYGILTDAQKVQFETLKEEKKNVKQEAGKGAKRGKMDEAPRGKENRQK